MKTLVATTQSPYIRGRTIEVMISERVERKMVV
jgi:hypothetical protein